MDVARQQTRRNVFRGVAAGALAAVLPRPALAQAAARVVVIGGGFAGAACARALRRLNAALQVTLVEPKTFYFACPFSNEAIVGLRTFAAQQFSYDKVAADGI